MKKCRVFKKIINFILMYDFHLCQYDQRAFYKNRKIWIVSSALYKKIVEK